MMETMIVALWVMVFTGLALAPFSRSPWLLWTSLAAMVVSIVYAAATAPTPWGMNEHLVLLLTLFAVPLAGRLTGTLAHRVITGTYQDASNPDGTDGFDALAGRALAKRD